MSEASRLNTLLSQITGDTPNTSLEIQTVSNSNAYTSHGGLIVARALKAGGVQYIFALSGGHICM